MTSCASPAASTASKTSTQAHPSPKWVSTASTIPVSVSSPSRIERYCASVPASAESTTTHRSAYPNVAPAVTSVAIEAGPAAIAPAIHDGPILPAYSPIRPNETDSPALVDVSPLMTTSHRISG